MTGILFNSKNVKLRDDLNADQESKLLKPVSDEMDKMHMGHMSHMKKKGRK